MSDQLPLYSRFDQEFAGRTFDEERDGKRLRSLMQRVKNLVIDGRPRTLEGIRAITGGSVASISARLRDLRKKPYYWPVMRRHHGDPKNGVYEYAVVWNDDEKENGEWKM